jgi:glycosyltransferase involved in cell wall biosynthesis
MQPIRGKVSSVTRKTKEKSMDRRANRASVAPTRGHASPWPVASPAGSVEKLGHLVSVVIPTLNEADNLPHVLWRIPASCEILIVDGGSTDGTVDVTRRTRPDALIIMQDRCGKGNALACGFAAATREIVVTLDADGSARPEEISRFVQVLQNGADFAKGSRRLLGGGSDDFSLLRRAGNAFFSGLVNLLFGTKYTDLCYGYNAFWRRCLAEINVDCDGFEVETALNIRACKAGLAVVEVPSFEERRIAGKSKLSAFRDGSRVLRTIMRERFAKEESERQKPVRTRQQIV